MKVFSHEELVNFVRRTILADELRVLSAAAVNAAPIDDAERHLLLTIGLPVAELLGWSFTPSVFGFRTVSEVAGDSLKDSLVQDGRVVVAGGQDVLLCKNDGRCGHLVTVDLRQEERSRFVNTGIVQFMGCLSAYVEYSNAIREGDVGHEEEAVKAFQERLLQCDPQCICHEDNWWSLIVEQAVEGMI